MIAATDVVDLQKAIEGIVPYYIGDRDVKEMVLYAYCIFDPNRARETRVPIILHARSGMGKTIFLQGLSDSLGARIYGANDLTLAALGMKDAQGNVKYADLGSIVLIDELDKWSGDNISPLLALFGTEERAAVRYGELFYRQTNSWCIGTLLEDLGGLKDSDSYVRRKLLIEQLLRRSIALRLSSSSKTDIEEYTAEVVDEELLSFRSYGKWRKRLEAFQALSRRAEVAKSILRSGAKSFIVDEGDLDEIRGLLSERTQRFYISEHVEWGRELQRLVLRLAKGRAIAENRLRIRADDVRYILDILEKHANELGYFR